MFELWRVLYVLVFGETFFHVKVFLCLQVDMLRTVTKVGKRSIEREHWYQEEYNYMKELMLDAFLLIFASDAESCFARTESISVHPEINGIRLLSQYSNEREYSFFHP